MQVMECTSRIARVCVYGRGASVTRVVEWEGPAPEGACELRIEGITPQANPGSLRVEVTGTRTVTSLRSRLAVASSASPPADLSTRRRALALQRQKLRAEAAHLALRRSALEEGAPRLKLRGAVDPVARTRDGLATAGLIGDLLGDVDARLRELEAESAQLERERQALEAQASASQHSPPGDPTREVTIRLGDEGSIESLRLVYEVAAARWWPAYEARLSQGGKEAAFNMGAFVAQNSGESWDEVKLVLSTADLITDARLPELPSLRLGRKQPQRSAGYRPPPEGLDALFRSYDEAKRLGSAAGAERERVLLAARAQAQELTSSLLMSGSFDDEDSAEGAVGDLFDSDDEVGAAGDYRGYVDDEVEALEEPSLDLSSLGGAGGAPLPPPSVSMPSASFGAPPGMAMPEPMAKSAAGPMRGRAKSSKKRSGAAPDRRPAAPSEPPPEPPPLEPADAWLNFDALGLAGRYAGPSERGRLQHTGQSNSDYCARALQGLNAVSAPRYARDPVEERGRFDHCFEASALADVPSQASLTRVSLSQAEAKVEQVLRATPVVEEQAYREAALHNPLEAPLLSGPVDVYLDGSLLTTSALENVGRGGRVRLGLGVEERVRVARNARVEESTSGLIGKTTSVVHDVRIELRSSLGVPARVVLIDRVPVGDEDDDVTVTLVSSDPPAEPYDQQARGAFVRGGLRWELDLPAGASAEVCFRYRVDLPAKREIVGGNRRD